VSRSQQHYGRLTQEIANGRGPLVSERPQIAHHPGIQPHRHHLLETTRLDGFAGSFDDLAPLLLWQLTSFGLILPNFSCHHNPIVSSA
jgi:hypothetical protein